LTSPAVWGPLADSSRLEVKLHWKLCRRRWSGSYCHEWYWRRSQQLCYVLWWC